MELTFVPHPDDLAALALSLRDAAARAQDEDDAMLRQLGAGLREAAERLERRAAAARSEIAGGSRTSSASAEVALRSQLMMLHERALQLRLILSAEACLVHADPPRARAASQLLQRLPAPEGLATEDATLVGGTPLSAEAALATLAATQEILAAAVPERDALEQLGLLPLVESMDAALRNLTAAASRLFAFSPTGSSGGEAGLGAVLSEAAERCAQFRAYVLVSTGHLSRRGDDPDRRLRLLAPLSRLAGLSPFFVAR